MVANLEAAEQSTKKSGWLVRRGASSAPAGYDVRRAAECEFLPAALEVMETPASPRHFEVIGAILALFACVGALSYFGYIEDYTLAPGKIQTIGRTKVVEPRETGQVTSIRVADGDRVKEGAILIELDPTNAFASRAIVADQLFNTRAEMARLSVELTAARAQRVDTTVAISWDGDIPSKVREREEGVLRADLSQLAATLADLAAQRKAAEVSRDKYSADIVAENALLAVTSEHVSMNESLEREGWNSRVKVLEILEKLRKQQIALSAMQGGLANAEAAIPIIDAKIAETREVFFTNATQQLASLDRQADDLKQKLIKADQTLANMTLRSPLAGVIHATAVTTIGQVVKPGQQLMQVVPADVPLEIIGYVTNTDSGFVKVGQKVEIELDTFPYATYGTIPGTVTSLGRDAMPADTTKNKLQAAALDGDVSETTAAQKTGNIVFPVTIEAARSSMNIDGRIVDLSPGMAVMIDIKTENRRAIDYVASPLIDLFSTAAHEQ